MAGDFFKDSLTGSLRESYKGSAIVFRILNTISIRPLG